MAWADALEPGQRELLLTAAGVRNCAHAWLERATNGDTDWEVRLNLLPQCADYVAEVIRKRHPTLNVPFHARWRHFVFNGRDSWDEIAKSAAWRDAHARARAEFDLAITSVLLDAGAGPAWRYEDTASGLTATRSEGLALASLRLFEWGGFSADVDDPLRADAAALQRFDSKQLADAFQSSPQRPLTGLDGRARLFNRVGAQCKARADLFALADNPRPGGLYDALAARTHDGALPAPAILELLLEALGPIWENRPTLNGVPLGDCWEVPGFGYTPLHKLSQWLAYSLIEPLERAGIRVTDVDGLTGLAEYRNGGLFIDMGVLAPRASGALTRSYDVAHSVVVTWRALTIALLDRIAPLVRERLGVTAEAFPLARVLEGGAWWAGRLMAREKRADGGPPISVISDGTVF